MAKLQDIFFDKTKDKIGEFKKADIAGKDAASFINDIFANVSNVAMGIISLVAAIAILYLAISLLTAGGDDDKIKKIKTSFISVFLGFFVAIFAVVLVNIVLGLPSELLGK